MDTKPAKRFARSGKEISPASTPVQPVELDQLLTNQKFQGKIVITEGHLTVPPANVIAEYIPYYPDAALTFFRWAEEEAAHRRKLDDAMLTSQIRDSRLGLWLGFLVALCGLGVAGLAAFWGQPWVAGILGGGTIVSLATAFIRGRGLSSHLNDSKKKKP